MLLVTTQMTYRSWSSYRTGMDPSVDRHNRKVCSRMTMITHASSKRSGNDDQALPCKPSALRSKSYVTGRDDEAVPTFKGNG